MTRSGVRRAGLGSRAGAVGMALAVVVLSGWRAAAADLPLIAFGAAGALAQVKASDRAEEQVAFRIADGPQGKALDVTLQPGKESYPGVYIRPVGPAWDLSACGHVEARVANTGARTLCFNLRLDNPGDWRSNLWNCEQLYLKPGATGTVSVIFGYSYGRRPAYALKPGAVASVLLFAPKSDAVQSFRLESLTAGGPAGEKPPIDPNAVRIKPLNGVVFGAGMPTDVAVRVETQGGVQGAVDDHAANLVFPAGTGKQAALLRPVVGRWDLREACEVCVTVKNQGQTPITPAIQVTSDTSSGTDVIRPPAPLAPGAAQEIVVPFAPAVPWRGVTNGTGQFWPEQPGTATKFCSDKANAIRITAVHEGESALRVESIVADAPPAKLPDWLGKRPPVEGDWVKTFDDEFDGTAIDRTKWNDFAVNYWDKRTHWSKDNTIVGGGVVRLRYEKKRGDQNDDPKQKLDLAGTNASDYAAGILETYGKWVQRYGYFEARMKLPRAPGLWPAFWMMPDRGVAAGPQWKRQDTYHGGMELDILEHLTRWGPCRYNIGLLWDGYQKDKRCLCWTQTYVQPDRDGFLTCGLLWVPGQLIYYCNGREVGRWESPRVSTVQSDLMFTLPMGGWDNSALDDAQLPADFVIDYVRVWQRKDLASAVDGFMESGKAETQARRRP